MSRGETFCRLCSSTSLFQAIDLGRLPIANELPLGIQVSDVYRLVLKVCSECSLGQVGEYVSKNRLFKDYRYTTSASSTMLRHAEAFVGQHLLTGDLKSKFVVEIASNDGYLLAPLQRAGVRVLGIEPAENVARVAREKQVPTVSDFFTKSLANNIRQEFGVPTHIVANNVAAHVPDLLDFFLGLKALSGPETLITIENPDLLTLLECLAFDTVYHEHYSYLSATAVYRLAKLVGLTLFDLERIESHGGSLRYWLKHENGGASTTNSSVIRQINAEQSKGLNSPEAWFDFSRSASNFTQTLRESIEDDVAKGKTWIGFGAAAKASTLLNFGKFNHSHFQVVLDNSSEKVGRFIPNTEIQIQQPAYLFENPVDAVYVFPWNIAEEVNDELRNRYNFKGEAYCFDSKAKSIKKLPR